jgi:hypothetical protein
LTKTELQTELGIASLPARRYLWDLIKSLRLEHEANDYSVAIRAHEEEIQTLQAAGSSNGENLVASADEASGGGILHRNHDPSLSAIFSELTLDAQRQRQITSDHMLALKLQRGIKWGQDVYDDAELAHQEQQRLNGLLAQAESDRQYAETLLSASERATLQRTRQASQEAQAQPTLAGRFQEDDGAASRFTSLFGLALQACADNKVNVAEAFRTGKVKPVVVPVFGDVETDSDDDRKPAAIEGEKQKMLPFLEQCHVCYEENIKGFTFACDHAQCTRCTRKLFKAALRDNTLLPLRCCEIPIDMNIATQVLKVDEVQRIVERIAEMEATNKMYCPTCSTFINLDLIDWTLSTDLKCGCGTLLCIECKTSAHPGMTCQHNKGIQAGSDELVLQLAQENNWKRCPNCETMIELRSGCNHMTCANCRFEFCYSCLRHWNSRSGQCSSGTCALWDEERLVEAGEARVQQEEAAIGQALAPALRRLRLARAVEGLRANEVCNHSWVRSGGYKGDCPNCDFTMWAYGMQCRSDCGATVCYTCANHRIPRRGWR